MAVSVVPIYQKFYLTVQPSVISFLFLPYVFWSLEAYYDQQSSAAYVSIVLVFFIIFYHPVSTVFIFIGIVVYTALPYAFAVTNRWTPITVRNITRVHRPITLITLCIVPALMWYLSYQRTFVTIAARLGGFFSADYSAAGAKISAADNRGLTTEQTLARFVELYGSQFVLAVVAGSVLLFWFYRVTVTREMQFRDGITTTHFIIATSISMVLLVLPVISNIIRMSRYAIFTLLLVIGMGLAHVSGILDSKHRQTRARIVATTVAVVLVLCLALPLGLMGVYQPNHHHTYAEHNGIDWTLDYHDRDDRVYSLGIGVKVQDALEGRHNARADWVFFGQYAESRPDLFPRHLGYGESETVVESFDEGYLITKTHDMRYYESYYETQLPILTYYTKSDVARLHGDQTAHKTYSNGGWTTWRLRNDTRY